MFFQPHPGKCTLGLGLVNTFQNSQRTFLKVRWGCIGVFYMLNYQYFMKIILANPRGFCAGVDRAVDIVELALLVYGQPIYVKHQIVHNNFVVSELEKKGAIFVENVEEIPEGSRVVFSAHGSKKSDYEKAHQRKLQIIDATCPLVTKVHLEAIRYHREGYFIVLIGHKGHVEPIGTMSEVPEDSMVLVEKPEEAEWLQVPDSNKVAFLTQTTLSIDDTKEIIEAIKKKFSEVAMPAIKDICYATTNRQRAVKELAKQTDLVLVVGSKASSNSNRLVEVAHQAGCLAYLVDSYNDVNQVWLENVQTVGITSGASAPEVLVQELVSFLKAKGAISVKTLEVSKENVFFGLPNDLIEHAGKHEAARTILDKHHIKQRRG